ncbi:MAG: ketopantoate reductase C-terminal domain-containing protein [Bacteroidota bacterium]
MTVNIIGTGAVGQALAVSLAHQGRKTRLIRATVQGVRESPYRYSIYRDGKEIASASIPTCSLDTLERLEGVVAIATKSYGNALLAEKLAAKESDIPIIILQNGLNVETPFVELGFSQLYRCVLFMTSQMEGSRGVSFKPVSASRVGTIHAKSDNLAHVVAALDSPLFSFEKDLNIRSTIWQKVILNSVFNSICPLLGIDNGIFYRDPKVLAIAKTLIEECMQVAALDGIILDREGIIQKALQISQTSDGQLISTLQDLHAGRPTEIQSLNLEIARIAQQHGREGLCPQTRLLGEMILAKSALST